VTGVPPETSLGQMFFDRFALGQDLAKLFGNGRPIPHQGR